MRLRYFSVVGLGDDSVVEWRLIQSSWLGVVQAAMDMTAKDLRSEGVRRTEGTDDPETAPHPALRLLPLPLKLRARRTMTPQWPALCSTECKREVQSGCGVIRRGRVVCCRVGLLAASHSHSHSHSSLLKDAL